MNNLKAAIDTNNRREGVKVDLKIEELKQDTHIKFLQEKLEKFVHSKASEEI